MLDILVSYYCMIYWDYLLMFGGVEMFYFLKVLVSKDIISFESFNG